MIDLLNRIRARKLLTISKECVDFVEMNKKIALTFPSFQRQIATKVFLILEKIMGSNINSFY